MAQPYAYMSSPKGTMSAADRKARLTQWQGTVRNADDDLMKTQARTTTPTQTATRATTVRTTTPTSQNAPTMRTQATATPIGPQPPPQGWTWNAQTSNWTPPATGQNAPTMSANATPAATTPTPGYRASPYDWAAQTPNVSPGTWRGKGRVDINAWQQKEREDIQWRNSLPQATRGQSIQMAMRYLDPSWTAPAWLNKEMEGEAQSANVPGYAYGLRPEYIDALLRTYKTKAVPGTPEAQKYKEVEAFLRSAANANFQGSSPTVAGGMVNGWPEWILRAQSSTGPTTPPTTPGTPTMQPQPGTPPVQQYQTPTNTGAGAAAAHPANTTTPAAQAQVPLYNVYIPGTGTQMPTQTVSPTVSTPSVPTSPAAVDPAMQQYLQLQQYFLNGGTPTTTPTAVPGAAAPAATPTTAPAPGYQGQWPIDITPPPPSYQGAASNPLAMSNPLAQMLGSGVGAQAGAFPWYGGAGSGTSPVPNPQPAGGTTMPTAEEIAAGNQVGDFLTYFFGAKPAWFNDPNWAANPTTRATVQAWVQAMQPYMQTYQNAYQYGQDFNEAQRRWNTEQGWQQQMDAYNAALTGRQQNMAEWQAQEAARQYQQTMGYQQQRDASEMDLAKWQTNQQVWGRNVAPNVNWIRQGWA